jgi:hypothetical protein
MVMRLCNGGIKVKGELDPFVLILEGSVPNEEAIKDTGGYWAGMAAGCVWPANNYQ